MAGVVAIFTGGLTMSTQITQISEVHTITPETFKAVLIQTADIHNEIEKVFREGTESEVKVARIQYDGCQSGMIAFFPNADRGAVVTGGDSVWLDCLDLDNLVIRFHQAQELGD